MTPNFVAGHASGYPNEKSPITSSPNILTTMVRFHRRPLALVLLLTAVASRTATSLRSNWRQETTPTTTASTTTIDNKDERTILCQIVRVDSMPLSKNDDAATVEAQEETTHCIPVEDNENELQYAVALPDNINEQYAAQLNAGTLYVQITHARIVQDILQLNPTQSVLSVPFVTPAVRPRSATTTSVAQVRSFVMVRISTTDSVLSFSRDQMNARLAPTSINFASQYNKCSHHQLSFVQKEIYEVQLSVPMSHFTRPLQMVHAAGPQLLAQSKATQLRDIADHVLFCLPPGLLGNNWVATANVRHYRSWYNDKYCLSLSASMHEIGHNLNAHHASTEEEILGDGSGQMGFSLADTDYPQRCFNGYNTFQFGWFHDRTIKVDSVVPRLIALDSSAAAVTEGAVLIVIDDWYYVQFNQATGMNQDTLYLADQVTVTKRNDSRNTVSVAGIPVGDEWRQEDYLDTGRNLVLRVCDDSGRQDHHHTNNTVLLSIGLNTTVCDGPIVTLANHEAVQQVSEPMERSVTNHQQASSRLQSQFRLPPAPSPMRWQQLDPTGLVVQEPTEDELEDENPVVPNDTEETICVGNFLCRSDVKQ